ncbi:hypothetical protein ACFPRL_30180 [Pseudoclavibacter helvolus]
MHGGKDVENRSRNLAGDYRGPVAIHAGLAVFEEEGGAYAEVSRAIESELQGYRVDDAYLWEVADDVDPDDPRFIYGAILGVVDLVDVHVGPEYGGGCHKLSSPLPVRPDYGACSPWGEASSYHLVLANPRPLTEPIPFKGGLGLRRLDVEFAARVLEGVRA